MKRIILDTDPGVDDALAFLLAFSSPELKVEAVTTVDGNVSQEKGHRNAKQLLEFLERTDVPVSMGAKKLLLREMNDASEFHGKTGLMDANLPDPKMQSDPRNASKLILDYVDEFGKDLTLVAIGPLTNIASAIILEPKLPQMIGGLVIMGGAFGLTPYGFGNANPVAEFNIWHDPEAAKIVFDSGMHVVCAALDTTTHPEYKMSKKMFQSCKAYGTRRSSLIGDLCGTLVDRYDSFSLHDPMAVTYVIDPTMFKTEKYHVDIETAGEYTMGMTVIDRRRGAQERRSESHHEIIMSVDASRFHKMFMERVVGGV